MMYHSRQFLKSVAVSQRTNGVRQVAKAAQRVLLVAPSQMGMFMVASQRGSDKLFASYQMKHFSSSLPAH